MASHRRAVFALIELDDAKPHDLAAKRNFDGARDELIRQYAAN